MPLLRNPKSQPAYHPQLRGIAFMMDSRRNGSMEPIRIVISFQALAALSQQHDFDDASLALEYFEKVRDRVERSASLKFDTLGVLDVFESFPTFLLMTGDPFVDEEGGVSARSPYLLPAGRMTAERVYSTAQ